MCAALSTTDWIRIVAAALTLAAVVTAWLQPVVKRLRLERRRLRGIVALYLRVFLQKLSREAELSRKGDIAKGKFEEYNRRNYDALETALVGARGVLPEPEYRALFDLVSWFKTSDTMKIKDIEKAQGKFQVALAAFGRG